MSLPMRYRVKHLYKTLLHLGKDYPRGYEYFRSRLHASFIRHKDVESTEEVEALIAKGEYVVKELEALYMLRKYRTLKKRYYDA
ncbi:electron transfer flavoprotein regulatory factor 1 [Plakobranchus ocellatus]|uniref:Electron transfer flavoprotein regulatory factor 1 n=1 Tax=Plakobranchus ocellatus TaxID=259542 RepID=A0AAV4A393_9GAST|nr:electron transfer flavoprotein regulatory factor 1 [Plakobranchus ocellatus]